MFCTIVFFIKKHEVGFTVDSKELATDIIRCLREYGMTIDYSTGKPQQLQVETADD